MKKSLILGTLLLAGAALAQSAVVTIGGYGGNVDPPLWNEVINRFVKGKVAGVDVRYAPSNDYNKDILNQLSAGTAPDIFYLPLDIAPGLIASGKVLPLDGLVDNRPFLPSLNRSFMSGGKTYAVAKDFSTLGLVYNRDLFEEAKVPVPTNADTWAVFEDKITRVQKALGQGYYGTCFPADVDRFGAFAMSTGWKPFDSQGRTNLLDQRFVQAFSFYTGLVRKGVATQPATISAGWGGDCLKSEKVATAFEGGWLFGWLRDNAPNLKYGVAGIPVNASTRRSGNLLFTTGWAINADSKNRAAAIRVLQALTSPEAQTYQLEGGFGLPGRAALATSAYFKKDTAEARAFDQIFKGASSGNVSAQWVSAKGPGWRDAVNTALKTVMDGQANVQTALRTAQTAIDNLK